MNIHMPVFVGALSFQISRAGAQLLVKLCLALPETAKPFPKAAASFCLPPAVREFLLLGTLTSNRRGQVFFGLEPFS